MRGLYVIWPDFDYIDRAIDIGGIDTLIVAFYHLPGWPVNPIFDTWDAGVAVMERYKNRGIQVYACPSLFASWVQVDAGHRLIAGGREYPHIWCPMSRVYIDKFFAPFQDLRAKGLCQGIIYDPEPLPGQPRPYYNEIRCECDRCRNFNFEEQWAHRANIFKADKFNLGQLLDNSWWSLQCYSDALLLTEDTYKSCDWSMRWKFWKAKIHASWKHKTRYTVVPGAFMEVFRSTDDFIKHLKYIKSHCPFRGFWIYSQRMMSKNSRMTEQGMKELEAGYGYYERRMLDDIDPGFFQKLKGV